MANAGWGLRLAQNFIPSAILSSATSSLSLSCLLLLEFVSLSDHSEWAQKKIPGKTFPEDQLPPSSPENQSNWNAPTNNL